VRELQTKLKDLEKCIVAKVQTYPSVDGQIFYLVNISHFNYQVFDHLEGDQKMFLTQVEKTGNLCDDALHFRDIKPGHLDYFG